MNSCDFKPLSSLRLRDIEIKKEPLYSIKFKEAGIQYSLFSIIKGSILKFLLIGGSIDIDTGKKGILELVKYIKVKSGKVPLAVNAVEIRSLSCNLKSKEALLNARLSISLNLPSQEIAYLGFQINSMEASGLQLKNALMRAGDIAEANSFSIEQIKYDKIEIDSLKGSPRLANGFLLIDDLSALFLKGEIRGNTAISLKPNAEYLLNLEFQDLDLETLADNANLKEKAELNGRLAGKIALKGKGQAITVLSGDFTTLDPGGVLTIKDDRYLAGLARGSGQSIDILVESFKNYNYNKGVMKLVLNRDNLTFDIALDGVSGKRNLNIVIHDFKLWREEQ